MIRYKLIKLNAKMLIKFCEKISKKNSPKFILDIQNKPVYEMVVQDTVLMEDCALFHQMAQSDVLNFEKLLLIGENEKKTTIINDLLHKLVIVDFKSIYDMKDSDKENNAKMRFLEKVEELIQYGFILQIGKEKTNFMPFDKSENMTRQSRITFIDNSIYEIINEHLNLGMDFTNINVILSKYYAYRGLYLSTSKPVNLKLNEETLVVIPDVNLYVDFERYKYNTPIYSVEETIENGKLKYTFSCKTGKEKIQTPYDGQGFICPEYTNFINTQTGIGSANSFQIRLPFAKGMLHNVNFHEFLSEFDSEKYALNEEYLIYDAFGRKRDLKKAKIIMPQSMFKCHDWLRSVVGVDEDPMWFYCHKLERYGHKLFVANTDAPYGKSKISRLSYQMINTLDLDDKMFADLTNQHLGYVENPIKYMKLCEGEECKDIASWKQALFKNENVAACCYIKQQLKNTQSSLMKQLANGRLVVPGQMRYLARDLGFMLSRLINWTPKANSVANKIKLFDYRFFMPQGGEKNPLNLEYENWYGFFRSPHLSRNEQCLLKAFIPSNNSYTKNQKWYNEKAVNETYEFLKKYFGHLTGIVMVGNESMIPMALGGADFDGDLVNVVLDQTVAEAIKKGVYDKDNNKNSLYLKRKIPYIKVPSNEATKKPVPVYISFESINNTFSNKIGLISDAAICIGQIEYDRKKTNTEVDGVNKDLTDELTCAKCTILTGLEIDAAKHGTHPDLSLVKTVDFNCEFLEFKRKFEKFSKHPWFHMNRLETDKNSHKEWKLKIKGVDESIKYPKEVKGTYVNLLPCVFMEHLNYSLSKGDTKALNALFKIGSKVKKEKNYIDLESTCRKYMDFFEKMQDLFESNDVQKASMDAYYRHQNFDNLLERLYDSKKVEDIYENHLPLVYQHINSLILTLDDLKLVKSAMYRENWHLTLYAKKKNCLKSIFEILPIVKNSTVNIDEILNGKEWNFLFEQRDGGYKLLWYVMNLNAKKLLLLSKVEKLKSFIKEMNLSSEYIKQIIEEIETYNEKIFDKDEQKGYHIPDFIVDMFLASLKEMIEKSQVDIEVKIKLLFNMTKKKPKLRGLFWKCFSWDDLKSVIPSENKGGTPC